MKKLIYIILTITTTSCSALLDTKKDCEIVEDIIDDVAKEETGISLNLRSTDPQQ